MDFDWKDLVRTVAPTVATALGSPVAGLAVKALADSLLGDDTATEAQIEKALKNASPDDLLKLKSLEQDFILKMKELDINLEEIAYKDRDSARKLFTVDKRPQMVLSTVFILGYFVILYFLLSGEIVLVEGLREVAVMLLGVLVREVGSILSFWFGSSSGSKDKADQLKALGVK